MVMDIAKGALFAHQKAIAVAAHNIANVNTPGYSRQTLILDTPEVSPASRLNLGYGVVAESVQQAFDQYTTHRLFDRSSTLSGYEAEKTILNSVEALFNESTGNGLNKAMTDFWNGWQNLANNPGGIPERTDLLEKTKTLCQKFQVIRNDLSKTQSDMNISIGGAVGEINTLTEQIAGVNEQIVAAEAFGTTANDLRDQRNTMVENLCQYLDITYLENSSGAYTVMTKTGIPLVETKYSWDLSKQGNKIYWNGIENDISSRLTGGKIGAWLDIRDNLLPQLMANLDELAGKMIHEVNALHYNDGYNLNGETHQYFFDHLNTVGDVENGTWSGGSTATSGGDYTGRLEKVYTFTAPTGTVGGVGDLSVGWAEATTGRSGTITIPAGYSAGTAIDVDGVNAVEESSTWAGTSHATSWGNYTGSNDQYTFTVQSVSAAGGVTGTVGTDTIVIHWENSDGPPGGSVTLTPAYAGTAVPIADELQGLQIKLSTGGTLKVGDRFTVETEEGIDVSFSAGDLVTGNTFSISCADYTAAANNIALSSDVEGSSRNIAAGTSTIAAETGNNINALAIAALQDTQLTVKKWTYEERGTSQTSQDQTQALGEYYTIMVGDVGVLANQATSNQNFHQTMINQLNELRDSQSGVSLDEEIIKMMQAQYAFQAAAKLITTADGLFQTTLDLR